MIEEAEHRYQYTKMVLHQPFQHLSIAEPI